MSFLFVHEYQHFGPTAVAMTGKSPTGTQISTSNTRISSGGYGIEMAPFSLS